MEHKSGWKIATISLIVAFALVGSALGAMLWINSSELSSARVSLALSQDTLEDVSAQLTDKSEQLSDLQDKYPLNDFDSYSQLSSWASGHLKSYIYSDDLSEFSAACSVVEEAMAEGLLVWVDRDTYAGFMYTWCCAFADGALYFWCSHVTHYDGLEQVYGLYRASHSSF